MEEKKTKFLNAFANIPLPLRKEICITLDGEEPEAVTWNVAMLEIINDTARGKEILNKLFDLKILI